MIDRNRAWRRRKARLTNWKEEAYRRLFVLQFHDAAAKPVPALKQHQHGKLTRVQDLRLTYSLFTQSVDGFEAALP